MGFGLRVSGFELLSFKEHYESLEVRLSYESSSPKLTPARAWGILRRRRAKPETRN